MLRLQTRLELVREIKDGMGPHGRRVEELAHARPNMTAAEWHQHPLIAAIRGRLGDPRPVLRMWGIRDWPQSAA